MIGVWLAGTILTAGASAGGAVEFQADPDIERIVVTASTREQSLAEAPATISVITADDLSLRANPDLSAALRDVEGVSISGGSNFQDVFIRGLPGAYTLILVDGRRQSTREARVNGNAGFEHAFTPPAGAIERIEVVRGPMSSLYGSDAMGGVVNIITRSPGEAWSGSVGADYVLQEHSRHGDWGQIQGYAGGPVVDGVLGAQIWGRYYEREEDAIFFPPASAGVNGSEDYNLTGRLIFTPDPDHEITLHADTTHIRRTITAGRTGAPAANDSYHDNRRDSVSLAWNGRWSWGSSAVSVLREQGWRRTYNRNATGQFQRAPRAPEIANTVLDALFHVPLGAHTLAFGGQYIDNTLDDINPGRRDNVAREFSVWQRALFIENEWRLHPDFALTGGLRFDDHERYGGQWSPRLYAVWNASPIVTVKGGVSTGFRAPELRQVAEGYAYETGGANCVYGPQGSCGAIIGDPDISPETSFNYEAGVLVSPSRDISFSATVFRTEFEDKIDSARVLDADGEIVRWDEDPNYQLWYWYNLSDARIQGLELTGFWRATDRVSLRANYTYTDSEQLSGEYEGWPLSRTPEHMANIRADFDALETLRLWAAVNHHGEQINAGLRVGMNGEPVFEDGRQVARRYPSHTTADIGLNWAATEAVSVRFGVYNLTDERLDVIDYDVQHDGRRFWFGVSADF